MLSFHTDDVSAWSLGESDLVAAIRWRKSRGSAAAAAARGGVDSFFEWLHTARSLPEWVVKSPVCDPLWQVLWSRNAFVETGRSRTLADVLELFCRGKSKRRRDKMIRMLLNEYSQAQKPDPFELLALLTLLQTRRTELSDETLCGLFRLCVLSAQDLALEIDTTPPGIETADQHLLRRGELPLLISRVFESIQGASHLRRQGRDTLVRLVDEETDTDGTPHGRILERLPLFLAGFVRTTSAHRNEKASLLNTAARKRFHQLTQQAVLLAGKDGRTALASPVVFAPGSLLHAAVAVAELPKRDAAVKAIAAIANDAPGFGKAAGTASRGSSYSGVSDQSEWGGVAIFRGDEAKPRFHGVLDFHDAYPRFEATLDGECIVSGRWDFEVRVGGELLAEPDGWSVACWFSDEEADYIELLAELPGDIRLTRHVIYAIDENMLVLAASVQNVGSRTVEAMTRLSVPSGIASRDDVNRMVRLKAKKAARLIPLGLAQDPFEGTSGRLEVTDATVEIEQANSSDGVCIPIALDLNAGAKSRRAVDWRRLTVAEYGRALPKGIADAWRLRIGSREDSPQWMYYQSLTPTEFPRSVLGLHTPYEMVFGRFEEGEIDALVHVESE